MKGWQLAAIAFASLLALFVLAPALYLFAVGLDPWGARPWTLYEHWIAYGSNPKIAALIKISAIVSVGAVIGLAVLLASAGKKKSDRPLYGEARYATRGEIAKAGMMKVTGAIIGRLDSRRLLYQPEPPEHILLAAPTGKGKGQGFVIPNLLHTPKSVVVLDPKREAWMLTAGFRAKHGHTVYFFDPAPADARGHRWNPFFYVSPDPYRCIDDCQKIGHMVCPDPKDKDPFWESGAREVFLSIALYLFEVHGANATRGDTHEVTLGAVRRVVHHPSGVKAFFASEVERLGASLSPRVADMLRAIGSTEQKTLDGFIRTLSTALELFANPLTDAATSGNDFDLRELRKRPMSIYVIVTTDNRKRMAPIISLFFQQVVDLNTREMPQPKNHDRARFFARLFGRSKASPTAPTRGTIQYDPTLKHRLVLVLDEATSIGRIPALAEGISYVRGFGLEIWTIVQSLSQLIDVNGTHLARNYIANHSIRIVFAPNENADARDISEALGNETVTVETTQRTGDKASKSEREERRALLLPQEVRELGDDEQIILATGLRPIRCRKVVVRNDESFAGRICRPPALPLIEVPPYAPLPEVRAPIVARMEPIEAEEDTPPRKPAAPRKRSPKAAPPGQRPLFVTDDQAAKLAAQLIIAQHEKQTAPNT